MLTVWRGKRPRGASSGGTASGLALLVPDGGRAGQAAGLAPRGEHLVLLGEEVHQINPSDGGGDSQLERRW